MVAKLKLESLIVVFIWLILWLLPWGRMITPEGSIYFIFLVDMIRLGIAIILFILPGAFLYLLLIDKFAELENSAIIPLGFTFAVAIIAVIGLTGKITGASFWHVKIVYALIGGIELILLQLYRPGISLRLLKEKITHGLRGIFNNLPLLTALTLATLMTFHDYLFFIDDLSYLALLTNWQHSSHLGFINIVQAVGTLENPRFWLALFPMGQALLSEVSGIPGILLFSNYLEPYLVMIAILASYSLGLALGLSRRQAGFSVLIQITFFTWMNSELWPVGRWFFQSMAEDKVAATFILSPIFYIVGIRYLYSSSLIDLIMLSICAIGLSLTHPIILFYSTVVMLSITIFYWINHRTSLKQPAMIILVLAIALSPYAMIRLSDIPAQKGITFNADDASATYEAERYINVADKLYYGLNYDLLKFLDILPNSRGYLVYQYFRLIPIILLVSSVILAVAKFHRGRFYWMILATGLLVFFAAIPYTGWLLGYFVSARMLARASWYMPLGLGGVLLLTEFGNWLTSRNPVKNFASFNLINRLNLYLPLAGLLFCILFVSPFLYFSLRYRTPHYFENLYYNRQLSQVGNYIDDHTDKWTTNISLNYWFTQLLPGVSANTELISFREETDRNGFNSSLSINDIHRRIYASNIIISVDDTVIPKERCYFLNEYEVRYILAMDKNVGWYEKILASCRMNAINKLDTGSFILLELK